MRGKLNGDGGLDKISAYGEGAYKRRGINRQGA